MTMIILTFVAALFLGTQGANTNTANVDVTVTPQAIAGQPVPGRDGFTVCLGTNFNRDQYGREITPANGVANHNFLNLPVGALVRITVEKTGYISTETQRTLQAGWNNHVDVQMQPGSNNFNSPHCPAPASAPPPPPPAPPVAMRGTTITPIAADPPHIISFSINGGARQMGPTDPLWLSVTFSGSRPTEARVTEGRNFRETWAKWTPITLQANNRILFSTESGLRSYPSPSGWFADTHTGPRPLALQLRANGRESQIYYADIRLEEWDPLESTCRHASLSIL